MKITEEIYKNPDYWVFNIQGNLHSQFKEYMEENNLNQKQLAEKLGISKSYLSQILNGNFNHSIEKLCSLSLSIGKIPIITFKDVSEHINSLKSHNSKNNVLHLVEKNKAFYV